MNNYKIKRFYKTKNGKIFDTSYLFPHVECYFTKGDALYYETIDGRECYVGKISAASDSLEGIEEEE